MANRTTKLLDRVTAVLSAKSAFGVLLLVLLAVAVGHLYVLRGLTTLYLGLPAWLWVEVAVAFAMVSVAWIAVGLVTAASEGGE